MRTTSFILILLLVISCGKKIPKQSFAAEESNIGTPYDTTAIDSFSQGATSVDIARKIKMSSLRYQDSLKKIKLKTEEENLLNKAKTEKLTEEKKAAEKAKAALDKAKEKSVAPKIEATVNP